MAKNSDQKAFEEIYKRYSNYVKLTVAKIIKDPLDAEELVQDVFVKIYKFLDQYKKDKSFGYWIAKIAKNTAIDHIRTKNREETILSTDDDNGISNKYADHHTVATDLINKSEKQHLHHMVDQLKWKDRRIFKLRYEDHLKYEEIAKKLNVTVGTIKSHLHNVKDKLIKLNTE